MSDDGLLGYLKERFDKLETKVDDLAAVNARLAGHDDAIQELKDADLRLEQKMDGRTAKFWGAVGGVSCACSTLIYLAVHFTK